jgi:hypothetical protein
MRSSGGLPWEISPAKSTPTNGRPSAFMPRSVGRMMRSIVWSRTVSEKIGAGE